MNLKMKNYFEKLSRFFYRYISQELLAKSIFKTTFGRDINMKYPKTFNEKVNWLKFHSDTSQWSVLADKYLVRDYVHKCGLDDILVEIYAMWNSAYKVDFSKLPSSFVLKANNGCKTVMLVENKNELDEKKIKETLAKWLKYKYGNRTAEPHYLSIKPCIIAEQLLENTNKDISTTLIDYKFQCIGGEPIYVQAMINRKGNDYLYNMYDLNWNSLKEYINKDIYFRLCDIPRPMSLDYMLLICRKLSKDFKQVRIDLYEVNGKPYFGEMTFTSAGGYDTDFNYEFDLLLGNKLNICI